MPSFGMLPDEQDVIVTWKTGEPSLQTIRTVMECVPEIVGPSVTALYRQARGNSEFRIGRFEYLSALEVRRLCEERGLSVRLA